MWVKPLPKYFKLGKFNDFGVFQTFLCASAFGGQKNCMHGTGFRAPGRARDSQIVSGIEPVILIWMNSARRRRRSGPFFNLFSYSEHILEWYKRNFIPGCWDTSQACAGLHARDGIWDLSASAGFPNNPAHVYAGRGYYDFLSDTRRDFLAKRVKMLKFSGLRRIKVTWLYALTTCRRRKK